MHAVQRQPFFQPRDPFRNFFLANIAVPEHDLVRVPAFCNRVLLHRIDAHACCFQRSHNIRREPDVRKSSDDMQPGGLAPDGDLIAKRVAQGVGQTLAALFVQLFHPGDVLFQMAFLDEAGKRQLVDGRRMQVGQPFRFW